jgi:hypothetical protein
MKMIKTQTVALALLVISILFGCAPVERSAVCANPVGYSSIKGRVLDAGSSPILYAEVKLYSPSNNYCWSTTTENNGQYSLSQLPNADDYVLKVEKVGHPITGFACIRLLPFTNLKIDIIVVQSHIIPMSPAPPPMYDFTKTGGGLIYLNSNGQSAVDFHIR